MPNVLLLECGSNSLKVHFRSGAHEEYHILKFPWRLGRDVYETGSLSDETLAQALRTVEDLVRMGFERKAMLAIATEGLRDARNRTDLLDQLRERLQLQVRVISGREEASLLAEGYLKQGGSIPAFLMDIGGGSVQLVHISAEKTVLRDSLPLGVIRLHCLGEEEGKPWNRAFVEDYVESQLETACLMKVPQINATGGTVKALARVLEKKFLPREEIDALLETVAREGPPAQLRPQRRLIFLPGLIMISKVMHHTGASSLRQISISVGRYFLERLVDRLGRQAAGEGKDGLADAMRITNIRSRL